MYVRKKDFKTNIMNSPEFINQLLVQMYTDGYQIGSQLNQDNLSINSLNNVSGQFYEYLDSFLDQFHALLNQQGKLVDCVKGCSSCCNQTVFVSPFEAVFLKDAIEDLPFAVKEEVLDKIRMKNEASKNMSAKEYLAHRFPCPLLSDFDGSCILHRSRPVACRLFLSEDKKSCVQAHLTPGDVNVFESLYELPLKVGRALCEGFNQALKQLGLEIDEYKFEFAMNKFTKDNLELGKWIEGEKVFNVVYTEEDIAEMKRYSNRDVL